MRLIDADAIKLEKGFFENVDNVPKFFEWIGKQPTIDAVSKEKYVHALTALQLANEKLAYLGYKPYTEMDGEDVIDVWVKQMLFEERHKQNAVEVVRCENCVHWKDEGFDSAGKCELWNIVFEYDWFCADGEERMMENNKAVWVPCNPLQTRSSKFMCSWCGGIAYYPQNHHIKERSGCPYKYCPRCGKVMTIIEKGEE